MNCIEFESTLECLVEARGSQLSDEATEHRRSCAGCTGLWHDHCLLNAAVVAWSPVEVPAGLSGRVLRNVLRETPIERSNRCQAAAVSRTQFRAAHWAVVTTASCVVMVCWFAIRVGDIDRDHRMSFAPITLQHERTVLTNLVPVEVAQSVVALLADLQVEYRGISDETKATAADLVAVLPQPLTWADSKFPAKLFGSASDQSFPLATVGPGGADEIDVGRSIGNKIGEAIDFLWQSVPGSMPSG